MIYRFKKTFIGVGGREYINNPKLSFPEHVKIRRKGTDPKSGQPYASASGAFMETSSIAARLRCSPSAARQYLHRHGVRFRVVRKSTGSLTLCWRRLDVERLLTAREPVCRRAPLHYVNMEEAVRYLGVVRSYVYRLVKKGCCANTGAASRRPADSAYGVSTTGKIWSISSFTFSTRDSGPYSEGCVF